MIYCPHCGSPNKESSSFCSNCSGRISEQVERSCSVCGASSPSEATSCSRCGARLEARAAAQPGAIDYGELRLLVPPTSQQEADESDEYADQLSSDVPEAEESLDEMPEWLRRLKQPRGGNGASEVVAPESDGSETPDWLRSLRESVPASSEEEEQEPESDEESESEGEEESEPELQKTDDATAEREGPQFEIPKWLKAFEKQQAAGPHGNQEDAPVAAADEQEREESGPAERAEEPHPPEAGTAGVPEGEDEEALVPLAAAMGRELAPVINPSSLPISQTGGARFFEAALSAEPEGEAVSRSPTASRANGLIYLLVFCAALVPLFLPASMAGVGLMASYNTPTVAVYDQLQALPAGSTVLVSFDYDTGQAVELDPAATALVGALARRQVNVVSVSTTLTGAQLAQAVLLSASAQNPGWLPGVNFVNAGYVAGGEKGLRNLSDQWFATTQTDFGHALLTSQPLTSRLRGLADLALVVELAGNEENLRWWMEQAQPRTARPFVAAVSAAADSSARNYLQSRQLAGVLRGLTGAGELEWLDRQTGPVLRTLDAQSMVQLGVAALIVAGNISLFTGWMAARRSQPEAS